MEVAEANRRILVVDDDQRTDSMLVDHRRRGRGERIALDDLGIDGHHILDIEDGEITGEIARHVAFGDDAAELAPRIGNPDTSEMFVRQRLDRLGHGRAQWHERKSVAFMHDVAHMGQRCAQLSARMEGAEIGRRKAPRFKK